MVGHRYVSGAQRTWRAGCCHCWLQPFCWPLTCSRHGHSPVLHAVVLMRLLMFSFDDTQANVGFDITSSTPQQALYEAVQ